MKNGVDVIVGFCMCALNDSAVATAVEAMSVCFFYCALND